MSPRARAITFTGLLTAVSLGAGCSANPINSTTPTTGSPGVTQVFSGTLSPGGTQTYAFSLGSSVPLRIGLGALADANGNPITKSLTLTFGIPSGTGCGALHTVTASPSLATDLTVLISAGTYCVSVTDTGQLTADTQFGVRLIYGDSTLSVEAATITFANTVLPGGYSTRTFSATAAGTLVLTMDTIDQPGVTSLGLGVGFPPNDGAGCQLSQSFVASRGSQFSIPVDSGSYCVKVFDLGTLTDATRFSMRIQHP